MISIPASTNPNNEWIEVDRIDDEISIEIFWDNQAQASVELNVRDARKLINAIEHKIAYIEA